MSRESTLNSNIWKFYLYKIFEGMFFAVPIIVLFWQDNGLTLTQIMILQSIFAISVVILEIPTGYFADIFNRKKSIIIGGVTGLVGAIFYSIGHNFLLFALAEISFAVAVSFESGAISAFLYDTLKELKKEKEYNKIWGNALFYSMSAMAFSNILGGFIGNLNFRYTFYTTIPFFAMMIPLALSMKEPKKHKITIEKDYLKTLFVDMKQLLIENKKLRWIIIYSSVIFAFNQAALWLYQPYFKISGVNIAYFGVIFASFHIIAALSSKYAYKIEKKLGQKTSLAILTFLVAISYFLMSKFVFVFSFVFCFIQQFIRGFKDVVVNDYINKLTHSNVRATTLSIESFLGKLLYASIIPIFGWIADTYTLTQALLVISITSFVSGLVILIIFKRYKIL